MNSVRPFQTKFSQFPPNFTISAKFYNFEFVTGAPGLVNSSGPNVHLNTQIQLIHVVSVQEDFSNAVSLEYDPIWDNLIRLVKFCSKIYSFKHHFQEILNPREGCTKKSCKKYGILPNQQQQPRLVPAQSLVYFPKKLI